MILSLIQHKDLSHIAQDDILAILIRQAMFSRWEYQEPI